MRFNLLQNLAMGYMIGYDGNSLIVSLISAWNARHTFTQ